MFNDDGHQPTEAEVIESARAQAVMVGCDCKPDISVRPAIIAGLWEADVCHEDLCVLMRRSRGEDRSIAELVDVAFAAFDAGHELFITPGEQALIAGCDLEEWGRLAEPHLAGRPADLKLSFQVI